MNYDLTNTNLIDDCKARIINIIKYSMSDLKYRFLIRKHNPFKKDSNIKVHFEIKESKWMDTNCIKNELNGEYDVFIYMPLIVNGKLIISNNDTKKEDVKDNVKLDLWVRIWLNFVKGYYSFDIYDESKLVLRKYEELIECECKNKNILSLISDELKFEEKSSIQFFVDIIRMTKKKELPFNDFDVIDDIVRCSQDLVFTLGEVEVFKPYISHFLQNRVFFNGDNIYQYFPLFYDKRYLMKCAVAVELLYSFWDKIGDVLSKYFTTALPKRAIYFGKVIDKFPKEWSENEHFNWLREFKYEKYNKLNEQRIRIVHYSNLESDFHNQYRKIIRDRDKLLELQKSLEEESELLNNHYKLAIKGFEKACLLIKDYQLSNI